MPIIDLTENDLAEKNAGLQEQLAALLFEGFRAHWPNAWPDMAAARREVQDCLGPERINRVALEDDVVLGWVGASRAYHGYTWELHPLIVRPEGQGRGTGRALVLDLEEQVLARGGLSIFLGTDDEDGLTTLSNTDLYPDVWEHVARVRNLRGHPYAFYERLGYRIVGVIPDANGFGKPDILMAKRLLDWQDDAFKP